MCTKTVFDTTTTVAYQDIEGPGYLGGPQVVQRESTGGLEHTRARHEHAGPVVMRQQHLGTLIVHTTTAGTSVFIDLFGEGTEDPR